VAIRAVRREANETVKAMQKASSIGEDDAVRALDEVQKYTDSYVKKVDELIAAKEQDIMAV
ncbi:MAG: ribosome recycling factor, partial [Verrucomicrobiota bacterium]|jgi:ribosome recycling factor|nr:ribosome recycling factor [Verrucomicrobiota bacterium]